MKVRRYFAVDMRSALAMAREQQGPEVIILSNRRLDGGVEILTALEGGGAEPAADTGEPVARDPASITRPRPVGPQAAAHASTPQSVEAELETDPVVSIGNRATAGRTPDPAARVDRCGTGAGMPGVMPASERLTMPLRGDVRQPVADDIGRSAGRSAASASARPELWTDRRLVEDMRGELVRMRRLIEEELPGLAWSSLGAHRPLMARLLRRCAAAGLSPQLARELVQDTTATNDTDAWLACLTRLGGRLRLLGDRLARGGGWHVLLGPTGVGKTTLAVKLAAREVLAGRAHSLHLIGLDHRRVGAPEQLRAYARVLGLTVHEPAGVEEILGLAATFTADDRVIVDTAGIAPGMPLPAWLPALIEEGHPCLSHWVFPAPSDRRVLARMADAARAAGVEACCLTRLDECASPGPALSVIAESGLALAYLGTGPNIPDDLAVARTDSLLGDLAAATERAAGEELDIEVESYARALR